MNKKYQVFISSTFKDLIDERSEITKAILDLGHIPAGMESFLSADQEQLSYIKKIIDQCDYYILIVAGRYGSEDTDGVSYTEKEFDYAVSTGKIVLAMIHSDTGILPSKHVDSSPEKQQKLTNFIEKIKSSRLVSFWSNKAELKSAVIISLSKAFSDSPSIGWIRGSAAASEDILAEINRIRIENDKLKLINSNLANQLKPQLQDIAGYDDEYEIRYSFLDYTGYGTNKRMEKYEGKKSLTWKEIFSAIGPKIVKPSSDILIKNALESYLREILKLSKINSIFDHDKDVIKMHLSAMGLLKIETAEAKGGGIAEFISLTNFGRTKLTDIMAVRKLPQPKNTAS